MVILKLQKTKFNSIKVLFFENVDTEKVLLSNKISSDEKNYKYFIGYLYNDLKAKPLHTLIPKGSAYEKIYDGKTKWMYFFIENDDLLEKYDTI